MTNFHDIAVDNSGLDPLAGFDFEVWTQYSGSGNSALVGKFQSLTVSFRNATETYIELGERIPTYHDGEIQIAWVLEQGLVDSEFAARTFGTSNMRRDQFIGRSPRFHITFDMNAYDIVAAEAKSRTDGGQIARQGSRDYAVFDPNSSSFIPSSSADKSIGQRKARGRYELMKCKVDSVSMGVMAGRKIAAVRWEGVCEGYTFHEGSLQEFKTQQPNLLNDKNFSTISNNTGLIA